MLKFETLDVESIFKVFNENFFLLFVLRVSITFFFLVQLVNYFKKMSSKKTNKADSKKPDEVILKQLQETLSKDAIQCKELNCDMSCDGTASRSMSYKTTVIEDFLSGDIIADLDIVPGIGYKTKKQMQEHTEPIFNTFQLFGVFLSLYREDMSFEQHVSEFEIFLQKYPGIKKQKISIAIATYSTILFPCMHDDEIYKNGTSIDLRGNDI